MRQQTRSIDATPNAGDVRDTVYCNILTGNVHLVHLPGPA